MEKKKADFKAGKSLVVSLMQTTFRDTFQTNERTACPIGSPVGKKADFWVSGYGKGYASSGYGLDKSSGNE